MNDNKLNNIMNNLFDLLILSVKIGVSYLSDKWVEVKSVYFVVKESSEEVNTKGVVELDGIWNGGTTISKSNQDLNGESVEYIESPKSPKDLPKVNNDIIYDSFHTASYQRKIIFFVVLLEIVFSSMCHFTRITEG